MSSLHWHCSMLVGGGANSYAMQQGMELCSADELITGKLRFQTDGGVICWWCIDRARAVYIDHMNRLERLERSDVPLAKKARIDDPVSPLLTGSRQIVGVQDTVGAVAMDVNGTLCAGVSSGGLSLKLPGRVGHVRMDYSLQVYLQFTFLIGSNVWLWLLGPEWQQRFDRVWM